MTRLTLVNGKDVEVSQEEISGFITQVMNSNPDWHHSGLLTQEEVMGYLEGKSTRDELRKVARYILIYEENLAFTGYLFDKADVEPERTKEFNMPAIIKLRELYLKISDDTNPASDISQDVHEMENTCLEVGADPL